MKKRIYFTDFTYNTGILSSDYMPLGCGYVAAYAKSLYNDEFDIKLFKYHQEFLDEAKSNPPDIFASSCYVWNKNLTLTVMKTIKEKYPNCVTVLGGAAFPLDEKRQKLFLLQNPQVDFLIHYDGEISFANFLKEYIKSSADNIKSKGVAIDGCVYLDKKNNIIIGKLTKRLKDLDVFPSPYLMGLFDKFLEEGKFSPMIQTTRGCPFRCAYCWASNEENRHNIGFFSFKRVEQELNYIIGFVKRKNIFDLTVADSNFGLYEKDKKIIDLFHDLQQKFNYPALLYVNFGQGNRDKIVKNTAHLKGITHCFSTQSTDSKVLENIKRANVNFEELSKYIKAVHKQGKTAITEIITGLPYETRQSHMQTLKDLLDCGFDFIDPFTLMLLDGIALNTEEAHNKYKYDIRYRLIPRNFGKINDEYTFETEQVVVGTNTYNIDDYIYFRSFHGLLRFLVNNDIYRELLQYVKQSKVHLLDWLKFIFDDLKNKPSKAAKHFKEYTDEACSELWDSTEELKRFYSKEENYNKLITGELGENLMQKYTIRASSVYFNDYLDYFFAITNTYLSKKYPKKKRDIENELDCIKQFISAKIADVFTISQIQKIKVFKTDYDILKWISDSFAKPISAYKLKTSREVISQLSDERFGLITDIFKRYNAKEGNLHGLYKAAAVIYINNYFRKPSYANENQLTGAKK
ncbi:MAG: radical SAM protein [Candidatus Omnitrophica bacterium]|nr:radical SAM protein [Candidatus Omnitrophota bacterium]